RLAVGCRVLAGLVDPGPGGGEAERRVGRADLQTVRAGARATGAQQEGLLGVLPAVVVGADHGADQRDAGLGGSLADLGRGQQVVELPDPGLFLALLLTRGVVAGVLLEVALLAPLVDLERDRGTIGDQRLLLRREALERFLGQPGDLRVVGHGALQSVCGTRPHRWRTQNTAPRKGAVLMRRC